MKQLQMMKTAQVAGLKIEIAASGPKPLVSLKGCDLRTRSEKRHGTKK